MIDKEKDSDNFWISTSKVHVYMRQIYLIILNAFYISKSINYKTVAFMCVFFCVGRSTDVAPIHIGTQIKTSV